MKRWVHYLPAITFAYNCSPNAITGLSPFEIVFGRTPSFPLPNPEQHIPRIGMEEQGDHFLSIMRAMKEGQEYTHRHLLKRREQIKNMFDKFQRPMRMKEGDYVYVFYPKTMGFTQLQPRAFGPFPVTCVSRMLGTEDPVGVTVNIGTSEQPIYKRYARARVHPLSYVHRDVDWNSISDRAAEMRNGTQEFMKEFEGPIDLTVITDGGQRRFENNESVDIDDIISATSSLYEYVTEPPFSKLYQPLNSGEIILD